MSKPATDITPLVNATKIPKERTIIAFFVGAFFGRYGIPFGIHLIYISLLGMFWLTKNVAVCKPCTQQGCYDTARMHQGEDK